MRCIEIFLKGAVYDNGRMININMRCIEILNRIVEIDIDKHD